MSPEVIDLFFGARVPAPPPSPLSPFPRIFSPLPHIFSSLPHIAAFCFLVSFLLIPSPRAICIAEPAIAPVDSFFLESGAPIRPTSAAGIQNILSTWRTWLAVPEPAHDSSHRTAKELLYLHKLQSERSDSLSQEALRSKEFTWHTIAGSDLPSTTLKRYDPFFRKLRSAVTGIGSQLKDQFHRTRPTTLEPKLRPVFPTPSSSAYPGGHALMAHLTAFLLSEMHPEHSDRFMRRAQRITWLREVAGIHYPTDGAAGASAARQIADRLLASLAVRTELAQLTQEPHQG